MDEILVALYLDDYHPQISPKYWLVECPIINRGFEYIYGGTPQYLDGFC